MQPKQTAGESEHVPEQKADVANTESGANRSRPSYAQVARTIQTPFGGEPLPNAVKSRIGQVLDVDVNAVRVHSGNQANQAAQAINARAFTNHNHIYLAEGESSEDLQLMAHESTHVAQQKVATGLIRPSDGPPASTPMIQRFNEGRETPAETSPTAASNCDTNEADPIIWFEHNSTNLRQDSEVDSITHVMRLVGRVQRYLAAAGEQGLVFLYGYASQEGDPAHNLVLSINRALRVRQLLMDAGVPAERIVPFGFGESRAFRGLRWNRRVEICLAPPVTFIEMPEERIDVARIDCDNPPQRAASFSEYVQLVRCLERLLPYLGPREMLSLLRQTYYGGRRFSEAIPCEQPVYFSRLLIPPSLNTALQNSKVVGGVDIGHLFTGLEAMMCPRASVEFEIDWAPNVTVEMPNVELVTWGGDLGSAAAIWTEDQFDKGLSRSATDYVGGGRASYAGAEDLRGDIDSYVLRSELMGRPCSAPPVIPGLARPLSSILFDYYVRAPEGEAPTDRHRSRCFALAIGGALSGSRITNKGSLVSRYKPRIYSFAYPFYFRRHKSILILGGVAYVLRRDSLEEKSGLVMREFLEWLDDNMG